jgi:hypothetical protein
MASRSEADALLAGITTAEVVTGSPINMHYLHLEGMGTLATRAISGAFMAVVPVYGEVAISYDLHITQLRDDQDYSDEGVVSGTIDAFPENSDFETKDIFDDPWQYLGVYANDVGQDWSVVVLKLLNGVVADIVHYATTGQFRNVDVTLSL